MSKVNKNEIKEDEKQFDTDLELLSNIKTHLMTYATSSGSAVIRPEDEGKIKSVALKAMYQQTDSQLDQIVQQMKPLLEQAQKIKDRIEISEKIYTAKLSFEPTIGHIYHLYKKDGEYVLSMLSPKDWKNNYPYDEYEGGVELLADHTWRLID